VRLLSLCFCRLQTFEVGVFVSDLMVESTRAPWPSQFHDSRFSNQVDNNTILPEPNGCPIALVVDKPVSALILLNDTAVVTKGQQQETIFYIPGSSAVTEHPWNISVSCASLDGLRLFGSATGEDESFTAYNRSTRAVLWSHSSLTSYFYNDQQVTFYLHFSNMTNALVDAQTGSVLSFGVTTDMTNKSNFFFAVDPIDLHPIFFDADMYRMILTSVDYSSWTVRWKLTFPQTSSLPPLYIPRLMTEEGILIIWFGYLIYAVYCSNGTILWARSKSWGYNDPSFALLSSEITGYSRSLLVVGDAMLYVLDPFTGSVVQIGTKPLDVYSVITVGRYIIVSGGDASGTLAGNGVWKVAYDDLANGDVHVLLQEA
jgi:hypothetical protein